MKKSSCFINLLRARNTAMFSFLKFFFIIFLVSCSQYSPLSSLTKEERNDLEYFLRMLMFHDSGSYVLFGSKPLCFGAFIEAEEREKMDHYRRNMNKGWNAWQKIKGDVNSRRYVLVKISQPFNIQWPDHRDDQRILHRFLLADVKKTALVLERHYEFYKSIVGEDFHPLEVVYDLENPDSSFWNAILFSSSRKDRDPVKIHKAIGLLFGFGEDNATLFSWREQARGKGGKVEELFNRQESLTTSNKCSCFSRMMCEWFEVMGIPGYISFDEGKRMGEFEQERKKIQKIYRGRDFLRVTLKELSK